jgi:hypothetical protein
MSRRKSVLERIETRLTTRPQPTSLEWRIFVPCHPFRELSKQSSSREIDAILHDILNTITSLSPTGVSSETRIDTYIIGEKYFGLKFREGGKLELKTRLHGSDDLGIEEYRKTKYGKKEEETPKSWRELREEKKEKERLLKEQKEIGRASCRERVYTSV